MESFHYRSLSADSLGPLEGNTHRSCYAWVLHEFFVANLKKIISVRQSQSQFFQSARICVPKSRRAQRPARRNSRNVQLAKLGGGKGPPSILPILSRPSLTSPSQLRPRVCRRTAQCGGWTRVLWVKFSHTGVVSALTTTRPPFSSLVTPAPR